MESNISIAAVVCMVFSMVLFPIVVVGGGTALFVLAILSELSQSIMGKAVKSIDECAAHEMASQICSGDRA